MPVNPEEHGLIDPMNPQGIQNIIPVKLSWIFPGLSMGFLEISLDCPNASEPWRTWVNRSHESTSNSKYHSRQAIMDISRTFNGVPGNIQGKLTALKYKHSNNKTTIWYAYILWNVLYQKSWQRPKFQRINLEAARQAFFSLPVQSFVGVVHSTMRDMDLLIGRNYQSEKNP